MGRGPESMARAQKQTACATVQRRGRAPGAGVPRARTPSYWTPCRGTPCDETPRGRAPLGRTPFRRRMSVARPCAAWRPAGSSSRTRAPARTPVNAGRRRTRRRPRRARRDTNRLRGDHPSGTSRILQVKMRGLSLMPGGGSSVGILTATRKATLAERSAFACHAQLDAREREGGRFEARVQRFACRGWEWGSLQMTSGRPSMTGCHRGE
jgi:hypothetical protein